MRRRFLRTYPLHAFERPRIEGDCEHAALSKRAVSYDIAAQRAGEATANGQAQAGTTETACGRALGLREGLENRFELVSGDAHTGIRHIDRKRVGDTSGLHTQPYRNPAGLCELDGVTDQVGDDLSHTGRICEDCLWNRTGAFKT